MLAQAQGVDVLIHEIVMPPNQWASHVTGVPVGNLSQEMVDNATAIVNSSHTTQGAFGYLLSQLMAGGNLPRLTAATHFQAQDDTVALAQTSIDAYGIPRDKYTFAADFMMLNVTADKSKSVLQRRLDVSKFAFAGQGQVSHKDLNQAKYHDAQGGNPYAQIDDDTWIPYTGYPGNDKTTYNKDGY